MSDGSFTPKVWPHGTRLSSKHDFAVLGDDFAAKVWPVPLIAAELELIDRPSGSKLLPVHPFGAHQLFERSMAIAQELLAPGDITDADRPGLRDLLWVKSRGCYRRGEPARNTLDRLMELAPKDASLSGDLSGEEWHRVRLQYLAVVCVAHGLLNWVAFEKDDVAA